MQGSSTAVAAYDQPLNAPRCEALFAVLEGLLGEAAVSAQRITLQWGQHILDFRPCTTALGRTASQPQEVPALSTPAHIQPQQSGDGTDGSAGVFLERMQGVTAWQASARETSLHPPMHGAIDGQPLDAGLHGAPAQKLCGNACSSTSRMRIASELSMTAGGRC